MRYDDPHVSGTRPRPACKVGVTGTQVSARGLVWLTARGHHVATVVLGIDRPPTRVLCAFGRAYMALTQTSLPELRRGSKGMSHREPSRLLERRISPELARFGLIGDNVTDFSPWCRTLHSKRGSASSCRLTDLANRHRLPGTRREAGPTGCTELRSSDAAAILRFIVCRGSGKETGFPRGRPTSSLEGTGNPRKPPLGGRPATSATAGCTPSARVRGPSVTRQGEA
jgi:hypothetical protein